jgi:hypothetical protein
MIHLRRAAFIGIVLAAGVAPVVTQTPKPAQLPPRDGRGTAQLSGVVSGVDGKPIAGATVALMSSGWKKTTTTSDERGRFAFQALVADTYWLRAEQAGFVEGEYGALRPGGEGTRIALAEAQRADNLWITLVRTGVITGTVRSADGRAAGGVTVYLAPADGLGIVSVAHTDERGTYRLEDVRRGDFKVHAMPADERVGVPVFHPGTTSPDRATTLRMEFGEERKGIDITLVEERPSPLAGTVLDLSGLPAAGVTLNAIPFAWGGGPGSLSRVTTTGSNGDFFYDGLFPGRYLIRGFVTSGPDTPPSDPATLWFAETIDVPLAAASELTLRLQPPLVFSGRVRFAGGRLRPPSDLTAVRIDLHRDGWKPTPLVVHGDGTFASTVLPGSYDLEAFVADTGRDWVLRSAMKDGRELLDAPIELMPATGSITDVELTFSDQHTGLSGTVATASGAPVSACYVVVFPADRALWSASYRRIRHQRPATNGRFVFDDLLPGDYLLAALPDLDPSWRSPEMLGSLVEKATRVTLREGERRGQDLRAVGR